MTLCGTLYVSACSGEEGQPEPQSVLVDTVTIVEEPIPNIVQLPGRIEPMRVAEVRARVNGIVQNRLYEEGTDVREGQPLFRIDPRELRATTAQAAANLQRSRATSANADAVLSRYEALVGKQAISQQENDAAVAAAREARAAVNEAEAQLAAAQLQLNYTSVRAPISGRAGRAAVTEGALVNLNEATLLTRIEQLSPVFVVLTQSSNEVLAIRRAITSGEIDLEDDGLIEVRLELPDGSEYPIPGRMNFFDYSVNETTSTVTLRGEIANPQRLLLPGDFVRARILAGRREGGVMVPQRAVQISESGASVFIVAADGTAMARPVELGALSGTNWIIEDGLQPGDVIVTSNLQQVRPGTSLERRTKANKQTRSDQPRNVPRSSSPEAR